MSYKDHKYYELARRAYYNISFRPEERAESECEFYESISEEFAEIFKDDPEQLERAMRKFETLFTASLSAKSRCLSSMITGPANFPVRRADKANASEHKRTTELLAFIEKMRRPSKAKGDDGVIYSDDSDAVEKLEKKIAAAERKQEIMKVTNAALRKLFKQKNGEVPEVSELADKIKHLFTVEPEMNAEAIARSSLKKNCFGGYGFEQYELTNNNANIRRMKARVIQLKKKPTESVEIEIGETKIVMNPEAHRVQILFPDIPSAEIRKSLKSVGFRWSPNNQAWQRHLSNEALQYAKNIVATGSPYQSA